MKINTLLLFFTAILLTSCFDSPNFPDTPKIEFKDVIFKRVGDFDDKDSLIIRIDFEDGDGDLGLADGENFFPYQSKNYFSNKTGQLFDFDNEGSDDLLTLDDRATVDSLPPFSGFFKCINWDTSPEVPLEDSIPITDTVYFQFNQRHYNIFITYMVKENGSFRTFDWLREIDCSNTFDGRFPVLTDDDKNSSLEGTIRYSMISTGFDEVQTFKNKTLKLRIQIVDRAGNFSNMVESPEFTLNEIQVN